MDDRCLPTDGPLADQIEVLWRRQCEQWPMLKEGLAHLKQADTRAFDVAGSRVKAQCNPSRVLSASAKVDAASLAQRPCFLCEANLPIEQRAVAYGSDWLILCNPMPIFDPHFVIATRDHQPQRLQAGLPTLLELARDLGGRYSVFYNGPMCGASAPDHLHLQAAPTGATPFENELAASLCAEHRNNGQRWIEWLQNGPVQLGISGPGRRATVVLISADIAMLTETLERVLAAMDSIHPAEPEPMVNLFATFLDQRWLVWFYPRRMHRPSCYGRDDDAYLISPGAVDLAGVLITPRQRDFERIDAKDVDTILGEVLFSKGQLAELRSRLAT